MRKATIISVTANLQLEIPPYGNISILSPQEFLVRFPIAETL